MLKVEKEKKTDIVVAIYFQEQSLLDRCMYMLFFSRRVIYV